MSKNSPFTLKGVDGNAFSILAYTRRAMKKAGLDKEIKNMFDEATRGDYYSLIAVCDRYVTMCNEALGL